MRKSANVMQRNRRDTQASSWTAFTNPLSSPYHALRSDNEPHRGLLTIEALQLDDSMSICTSNRELKIKNLCELAPVILVSVALGRSETILSTW